MLSQLLFDQRLTGDPFYAVVATKKKWKEEFFVVSPCRFLWNPCAECLEFLFLTVASHFECLKIISGLSYVSKFFISNQLLLMSTPLFGTPLFFIPPVFLAPSLFSQAACQYNMNKVTHWRSGRVTASQSTLHLCNRPSSSFLHLTCSSLRPHTLVA